MTPGEMVTATICVSFVLLLVTVAALVVSKNLKAAPPPLDEQVRALGVKVTTVEAKLMEFEGLVKRAVNREAVAETRRRKNKTEPEPEPEAAPAEPGELPGDMTIEDFQTRYSHFDPRSRGMNGAQR